LTASTGQMLADTTGIYYKTAVPTGTYFIPPGQATVKLTGDLPSFMALVPGGGAIVGSVVQSAGNIGIEKITNTGVSTWLLTAFPNHVQVAADTTNAYDAFRATGSPTTLLGWASLSGSMANGVLASTTSTVKDMVASS